MLHHLIALALFSPAMASAADIDWSKPPIRCIEDVVPAEPERECPDLSKMGDPRLGFPKELSKEDRKWWNQRKGALSVCRARELVRRAKKNPDLLGNAQTEWQRMLAEGPEHRAEKIEAIYEASDRHDLPPHVLAGALFQESRMTDLAITDDGGNYSCGIGQLNLFEWCRFAESLSPEAQDAVEWPAAAIREYLKERGYASACASPLVSLDVAEAFYDAAKERFGGSSHLYGPDEYRKLSAASVSSRFPDAAFDTQNLRFLAGRSFAVHCQDTRIAVEAKAHALRWLYDTEIPTAMHSVQRYGEEDSYPSEGCQHAPRTKAYPLHAGWLLADAAYNAGSNVVDLVAHYLRRAGKKAEQEGSWAFLTPPLVIESIFMGGDYRSIDGSLGFITLSGRKTSMSWVAACVAQRHVAQVVRSVLTKEGAKLVRSLEGEDGCNSGAFFGLFGGGVPESREESPGRIPLKRLEKLEKTSQSAP